MKFKDRPVFLLLLFGFIRKSDDVFDSLSHHGAASFLTPSPKYSQSDSDLDRIWLDVDDTKNVKNKNIFKFRITLLISTTKNIMWGGAYLTSSYNYTNGVKKIK